MVKIPLPPAPGAHTAMVHGGGNDWASHRVFAEVRHEERLPRDSPGYAAASLGKGALVPEGGSGAPDAVRGYARGMAQRHLRITQPECPASHSTSWNWLSRMHSVMPIGCWNGSGNSSHLTGSAIRHATTISSYKDQQLRCPAALSRSLELHAGRSIRGGVAPPGAALLTNPFRELGERGRHGTE
jgi:hypothetical protein